MLLAGMQGSAGCSLLAAAGVNAAAAVVSCRSCVRKMLPNAAAAFPANCLAGDDAAGAATAICNADLLKVAVAADEPSSLDGSGELAHTSFPAAVLLLAAAVPAADTASAPHLPLSSARRTAQFAALNSLPCPRIVAAALFRALLVTV
jgi:hypothetical protein